MSQHLVELDDYASGRMSNEDAAAFEERLFAAPEDEDVRFFDRTHRLMEWLASLGGLTGGATARDVEALRAQGLRVHVVELGSGGNVDVEPWGEDVQIVVFHNTLDLSGYEDVEVEVQNPDGTPIKTFRSVQCDPDSGNIYAVCAAPLAKMAYGDKRRISRITGVRGGSRETIALYDSAPSR
jgi:hypothetical protein